MNLLPKSVNEFSTKRYWDSFFNKRQNAFEWYGEYSDLCGVLHKYCKPTDHLLIAGCGNSELSADLYKVGYRSIINIDISDVVVQQMIAKNMVKCPEMSFIKMDLLDMKFDDESFQVVVDKGTLDAIFTNEDEKKLADVKQMFSEIARVLKVGGRYICITLAQEHIHKTLIDHFSTLKWFIRVHEVSILSSDTKSALPVFAFIITKTRTNSTLAMPQILEIVFHHSEKVNRLNHLEELKSLIKAIQEYSLVRQHLSTLHPGEIVQIEFWSSESNEEPRYNLSVVDLKHSEAKNGKFGVFIVPQGREHEWMFSAKQGQTELSLSAGYQRLVIVALNRGHSYTDLENIKEELSGKVMELAQDSVTSSIKAPFLSVGSDVGNRKVIHQGSSTTTGNYFIEDVQLDDEIFRRLIFSTNKNIIQSESRLCSKNSTAQSKSSKKKKNSRKVLLKNVIDSSYLACQYQQAMIASFVLLDEANKSKPSLLLIGLGGGTLPMFIYNHFPEISLTVVELDPDIAKIAIEWFDFKETGRMELYIEDGLQFIESACSSSSKYDVVIFDVNSNDATNAISCPPQQFLEKDLLNNVRTLLQCGGLFLLNLVCRDGEKTKQVVTTVQDVFPQVYNINIENDVNEVIICKNSHVQMDQPNFSNYGEEMQHKIAKVSPATNISLSSFIENLKII